MSESASQSSTSSSNKRTLFILAFVFVIPVLLAKFALDNNWFNKAATNKGELLTPALDFSRLNKTDSKKWRVAYVMPNSCLQVCDNALYSLNQIWIALGKEQDRVESVVLWTPSSDQQKIKELSEQQNVSLLMADEQNVNNVFKPVAADGIFLIDTLDNVILRYPLQQEQKDAVLKSRDILADLRKLLKLSRIG